jgi:2-methylcitrate dehydratase
MPTLGSKLAAWTRSQSFDALPKAAVHEVKRRVLDSIGCALGAYHKPPAMIAREKAASLADPNGGTVLGTTHKAPAEWATFANGAMVRYLDFNDTYLSLEPAHPSDNLPAAWAVCRESGPQRPGRDHRRRDRLRDSVPACATRPACASTGGITRSTAR